MPSGSNDEDGDDSTSSDHDEVMDPYWPSDESEGEQGEEEAMLERLVQDNLNDADGMVHALVHFDFPNSFNQRSPSRSKHCGS